MKKKIIIIGAGTAGLACGIRLQTLGFQCEIYEKNDQVGGRMYQIREKGFSFDVGPTIVLMPKMYQELFRFSGAIPDAISLLKKHFWKSRIVDLVTFIILKPFMHFLNFEH
jgi:phytoene desaturase